MIDIYKDAWHIVILDYTPKCIQSEHLSSNRPPPPTTGREKGEEMSLILPQGLS